MTHAETLAGPKRNVSIKNTMKEKNKNSGFDRFNSEASFSQSPQKPRRSQFDAITD